MGTAVPEEERMKVVLPNEPNVRLAVSIQDHGTYSEKEGAVVYLERDDVGRWLVYIWQSIDDEDPVRVYLDGALETRGAE